MREIKFRAWDGQGFHYWGFIDGAFFGPAQGNYGGGFNALTTPHDQFTGLHDADGVEIYESDIIALRGKPHINRVIEWDERMHGWDLPANITGCGSPWRVIGNIHENGDLLK